MPSIFEGLVPEKLNPLKNQQNLGGAQAALGKVALPPGAGKTISAEEFNALPGQAMPGIGQTISADQFNALPDTPMATPKAPASGLKGFGVGALKGLGSTLTGLSALGQKGLDAITKPISEGITGKPYQATPNAREALGKYLVPENTSQKIGFGAEQIGEFFIPMGALSKADKAIDAASALTKFGKFGQAATRVVGKGLTEGAVAGGIRAGQTGGDAKESFKTALTFGLLKGIGSGVGEGLRAMKAPEKLAGASGFKTSAKDTYAELKAAGIQNLQKADPARYAELVKEGVIKVGKDGVLKAPTNLAQEALGRGFGKGFSGSINNMANKTVKGLLESESKVQTLAKAAKDKIAIPSPKTYTNVLKEIAKDYKDVAFGKVSKEANALIKQIGTGKTSVETTLKLRRFLDKLRIQNSYNPISNTKLSLGQQNLKALTDTLRPLINKVPKMKDAMKDYAFNIDALESLAKEAAKRGNKELIGSIDAIMFGAGGLNPFLATTPLLKRMATTPRVLMGAAQQIQGGLSKVPKALTQGGKALTSEILRKPYDE